MNKQSGFSKILVFLLIALILGGVAAVTYFSMSKKIASPYESLNQQTEPLMPVITPMPETQVPVSEDDDLNTLRTELQNTQEGSVETDLNAIDAEASSL